MMMLFTGCPICRETNNMPLKKAEPTIILGFVDIVDAWCSKHAIDKSVLTEWKGKVIDKDDEPLSQKSIFKIF